MIDTDEIINRLRIYKALSAGKYNMKVLGLFGSCARRLQSEDSDVDVFVCLQEPDFFVMEQIKEDLENLLQASIDVVHLSDSLRPALKKNILKDAIYI